jgi:hypothetical protein
MSQNDSNIFDPLLYYLSHTGELNWEKFKDAVKRLTGGESGFKDSTYLTSLARLGHLDFDPMNLDRVVIAPTVLVETAVEGRYVLVGSRTPKFLSEIEKCVSETGGKFGSISEQYAPMTIVLSELTEAAFSVLERLGIHISLAFSAKLASVLPSPKRTNFPQIETLPSDSLNRFNPDTLKYEPDTHSLHEDGLYEIPQHGPDVYVLKFGYDLRKVPRDWGEWLVMNALGGTTGQIRYEKKSRTWGVVDKLLVPLMIDRCATLCSGFPPKWMGSFVCYDDVPPGIAFHLTKSLYQDWEVV